MIRLILIILFFLYGIPFWKLRYTFRSTVYRQKGFAINVSPRFVSETAALFNNGYFRNKQEVAMANRYRIYTIGYLILLLAILFVE